MTFQDEPDRLRARGLENCCVLDKFHLLCKHRQEQLGEEMHRRAEAAALSEKAVRGRVQQIGEQLYSAQQRNAALERELLHASGSLQKVEHEVESKQKQLTDLAKHAQRNRLWLRGKKEQIAATVKSLEAARKLICQRQDQVAEQEQQRKEHLERLHKLETELTEASKRLKRLNSSRDSSHELALAAQSRQERQRIDLSILQRKLQREADLQQLQAANANAQRQAVEAELRGMKEKVADATCRIRTAQSRKDEALQRLAQSQRALHAEQQDLKELLQKEAILVAEIKYWRKQQGLQEPWKMQSTQKEHQQDAPPKRTRDAIRKKSEGKCPRPQ